jgi:hypothetical protein
MVNPSNNMTFEQNGYKIIRNFLEPQFVEFIQHYFYIRISADDSKKLDGQAPFSYSFYSDPLVETILDSSCEVLSKISGIDLLPTYTYTRLYAKGEELLIHRDRESCQISATLSLGFPEGESINPIYFSRTKSIEDAKKIILNPGDLCLYRGCDIYHWRPPFTQKWYLQAFLHYVDANGPHKDNLYDGRPTLGRQKEK